LSLKEQTTEDVMAEPKTACDDCIHFYTRSFIPTCKAFTNRIPDSIWFNGNPHTVSVEGDRGIRYEKITH
jgi:hypothetical protein